MPNVLAEGYGETPFPDFPQVERREYCQRLGGLRYIRERIIAVLLKKLGLK
jgi:hypothetical protein